MSMTLPFRYAAATLAALVLVILWTVPGSAQAQ